MSTSLGHSVFTTVLPTMTATERLDVDDLSTSLQRFGIVDYIVFVLMLVICTVIGFYFGFIEKKEKPEKNGDKVVESGVCADELDYLVGGRKMKIFPISLSLVASYISGISLLGTSTEVYVYGTKYAFVLIPFVLSGFIAWYFFLPVFCTLQLTSTYEYFELRFSKSIRLMASVLFTLGTLIWLPIVIYVPALAFNQVTGVNIHTVTPVVCIICIFYTTVGGLKAVVWTDVIQTIIMLGAIIIVVIKGTINVGGLSVVWQRNMDGERLEVPAMTLDYTDRISMLSVMIGSVFHHAQSISGNQVIVQRYLSLPGMKEVKWACIWFTFGVVLLTAICLYNGLLLYATYYDCDPLTTKLAKAKDQLVPLLVMELLNDMPGVPGMFVAGVFSAALSSLSTGLNSLAAVFLEDYIKPLRKTPLTERQTSIIMRLSVVLLGILCVALVFVVESLGSHVVQLSMTFGPITMGPLLGLFVIGLLIPSINGKSALTGCTIAFAIMTIICLRAQIAMNSGELVFPEKPVSVEGCTYVFDEPEITPTNSTIYTFANRNFAQHFYHMSIFCYAVFGAIVTTAVAYFSSFIFGRNDVSKMNLDLFPPIIQPWIKASSEYTSVRTQEQTVIWSMEMKEKQSL